MKQDELDTFIDAVKSNPQIRTISASSIKANDNDLTDLERRTMKRMTANMNREEYINELNHAEIMISPEMKKMLYAGDNYLEMRQLGPRPEDMLYLGDGSIPNEEE